MELTTKQSCELAIVIALASVVTAAAVMAGRFDLISGNRAGELYDKSYAQVQSRISSQDTIEGDWEITRQGLRLMPGRSGIVTVRVQNDHEGRLVVFLYGRTNPGFHSTLSISSDGRAFREVAHVDSLEGTSINFPSLAASRGTIWIRFQGHMEPQVGSVESAVLSRLRVVVLKPPLRLPNLPIAALAVLTPVSAYLMRVLIRPQGALLYSLAVLAALAAMVETIAHTRVSDELKWWEAVMISQEMDGYFIIPYVLLIGIFGWYGRMWQVSVPGERMWSWFSMAGILAVGGSFRLKRLVEVAWSRLDPDAIGYMQLAEKMRSPYDTGSREPLWIWMIKGWFWLTGDSTVHLRLLTVFLSLVLILVAYKLFRDYTGQPLVGLLVAALLSVNPYLISLSVRGLREEAYLITVMGFVYAVLVKGDQLGCRSRQIGQALFGAAAHLLRFNSYTFVIPLLLLWAWRERAGKWRSVLLPLALIAAVSIPHLVHNAKTFGDPLYSVNVHFVWLRNVEFVILKQVGCAGCPSREQMEVNATPGPSLGAFEYLFGLHSVEEILSRTLQGYVDMYLRPTDQFEIQIGTQAHPAYVFYLLGLGLLLFSQHREMIVVIVLLANAVPFAVSLGIDPRLGVQTVPFATFILAYSIWWSFEQVARYRNTVDVSAWMTRCRTMHEFR